MRVEVFNTLLATAKLKNLTKAGELLGLTPSAVGKQIKDLEELAKTKFYTSSPAGIELTEEGEQVIPHALKVKEAVEEFLAFLESMPGKEEGPLKVIATITFGVHWLSIFVSEFKEKHPNIDLSIASDDYKSLLYATANSGVFVGLTSFEPPPKSPYRWQQLGSYCVYPYAHPRYIERFGLPNSLEELDKHKLIRYRWSAEYSYIEDEESNYLLYTGRPHNSPRPHIVTTDDAVGCRSLIENGVGVGLLPRYLAFNTPLVELLKDKYTPPENSKRNIYFVYPPSLAANKRVNIFKQFIFDKIKETKLIS